MDEYDGWERIEPAIGGGGQSTVYLARSPKRVGERVHSFEELSRFSGQDLRDRKHAERFAKASWDLARQDTPEELGALKIFDIVREGGAPAAARLKGEIAVLGEGRSGLPKLYAANESQQWMVTEYFPNGSLAKNPTKLRGQALTALHAFRTLVKTVATSLHNEGIVHRDIKPANIFVANDGSLVLGDFGIVYLPDGGDRPTIMNERVGPRDFMPPWADLGTRVEDVKPNTDVYMLGKLLWCMISGRPKLPREYFRRPEFDLEVMFADHPYMQRVNSILDKCVVERPDACLPSADDLLGIVDQVLRDVERDVPAVGEDGKLILRCRVCGRGVYKELQPQVGLNVIINHPDRRLDPPIVQVRIFICNVCSHFAFFTPGYPDEAVGRNWKAVN